MGRAGAGARRRPGRGLGRHHGAAGPAPDPGAAQPDRPHAQRRSGGLHRRRTRSRLAAGAAAAVGQSPRSSRASPATSRPRASCASWKCRRSVDRAQGDVHAAGNPHIQTDPRNIAARRRGAGARLQQLDAGERGRVSKRGPADFAQRWQQAIARWTAQAAPLQGVPVVVAAQGLRLSVRLARHARGGGARAQAGRRAQRVASEAGAGEPQGHAGAHGAVRGLPGPAAIGWLAQERRHRRS